MELDFEKYCNLGLSPRTVLPSNQHYLGIGKRNTKESLTRRSNLLSINEDFAEISFGDFHSFSCKSIPYRPVGVEMATRASICLFILAFVFSILASSPVKITAAEDEAREFVLTLAHSNFSDIVSKHDFVVVEFYAPWSSHCKKLDPEYEKAASILNSHDLPNILAKVDANDEANKELPSEFEIRGFQLFKILRNGGKSIEEYKGPREASADSGHLILLYLSLFTNSNFVPYKSLLPNSRDLDLSCDFNYPSWNFH
ncbi:hypothetical protein PVL29_011920 [Vitis rotundifolia]|uniref:protein disulfide-isomerase n=1 Tax=Vitis rotundifolia TaxID=103349 RepID=A0AA38ZQC0_VITRO|nr:hypothetical protein PVL29_011920 [Vitis rotundifolia]